jgi:hypothetical protein
MSDITLTLNETEQQGFQQLLDTSLRSGGLNALQLVSHFVGRLSAAAQASLNATPANTAPANTPAATQAPAHTAAPAAVA